MQDYRKLKVYDNAYKFGLEIYEKTKTMPKEERFGLTSQIRRSAISITLNIVEGCGKKSKKDFARYLQISIGSSNETEVLLNFMKDLKFLDDVVTDVLISNVIHIRKMLIALENKVTIAEYAK